MLWLPTQGVQRAISAPELPSCLLGISHWAVPRDQVLVDPSFWKVTKGVCRVLWLLIRPFCESGPNEQT